MNNDLTALVAMDLYCGIARDRIIPWWAVEDLKDFKKRTQYATLIMGHNTWDTLPNAVRDRNCIVLSRSLLVAAWRTASSVEEVLGWIDSLPGPIYVIGGEQIYRAFLPYYRRVVATILYDNFHCDKVFDWGSKYIVDQWKHTKSNILNGEVYLKPSGDRKDVPVVQYEYERLTMPNLVV